jgi:PadR family transcriptional regulator AphA
MHMNRNTLASSISFRCFILGLLPQQSMSGYDIKRMLERLGWLIGNPSCGSIYSNLHALLNDGLVTVEVIPHPNKPARKVYSIAEPGRQVLQEWAKEPVTSKASLKTFVMSLILAGVLSPAALIAHLQQRRDQVMAYWAVLEQTTRALDEETDLRQYLVPEYGLALATAELAWLDSTLDGLTHQSLPMEGTRGN